MVSIPGFDPNNTIGAMFLGCVFAAFLFGVTSLQVYIYYKKYPKDYTFHRIMVAVLCILNSLHFGFTISSVYHYVILHFGNVLELTKFIWPLKTQVVLNCWIIMLVQMLYATRVWKLGRHYDSKIPMAVAALVAIGWGCTIMLMVKIVKTQSFFGLSDDKPWIVYVSISVLTTIDVAIASSMCFYLSKGKTSFERTNNTILNIMKVTLASGFITSACSLTVLIVFVTQRRTMIFLCIQFLLTELYVMSYLSLLNARESHNYGVNSAFQHSECRLSMIVKMRTTINGEPTYDMSDEKTSVPSRVTDGSVGNEPDLPNPTTNKWKDLSIRESIHVV